VTLLKLGYTQSGTLNQDSVIDIIKEYGEFIPLSKGE
jgi:hypothetical protein